MSQPSREKILIIRFSSIGDVTQALSVPSRLSELNAEIHWVTRKDTALLLEGHPHIQRIWKLRRSEGISGLFRLIRSLRQEKFTRVYDAHNNMRSHLISWGVGWCLAWSSPRPRILRRSMQRWNRFLLLQFHINHFRKPFSGQRDFLEPLKAWNLSEELPPPPQIFCHLPFVRRAEQELSNRGFLSPIGLVPSAAYPLKRWPLEFYAELIRQMPQNHFLVFGGPTDSFTQELETVAPDRVYNLAGKLSLAETAAFVATCQAVVANDTGVLHMAEQLAVPTIALMGPAPFGFPSRSTTTILERELDCRPCSKHGQGPCTNPEFQKCLRSISVAEVRQTLEDRLKIAVNAPPRKGL